MNLGIAVLHSFSIYQLFILSPSDCYARAVNCVHEKTFHTNENLFADLAEEYQNLQSQLMDECELDDFHKPKDREILADYQEKKLKRHMTSLNKISFMGMKSFKLSETKIIVYNSVKILSGSLTPPKNGFPTLLSLCKV